MTEGGPRTGRRSCFHAIAANVDVAAMLIVARHPQGTSERLTIEHDETLVAFADFRDITLAHDRTGFKMRYSFQDRIQVAVAVVRMEHSLTAVAVQRLD